MLQLYTKATISSDMRTLLHTGNIQLTSNGMLGTQPSLYTIMQYHKRISSVYSKPFFIAGLHS